jgi:hypothetical protein
MTNRLTYLLLAFVLIIFANGCGEDEDPLIENEEEVITSVTLTLLPNGGQGTVTLSFSDPDGDGGNDPVFSTDGQLEANSSYRGQLSFANATGSIDAEIIEEGIDHQAFYQTTGGLAMTLTYLDSDQLQQPLGLMTDISTGVAGSGQLTITLRHEPTKGPSVTISRPDLAGGETDVEVIFDVTVQ